MFSMFVPGSSHAMLSLKVYQFGYYFVSASGDLVRTRDITITEHQYRDGNQHLQVDNRPAAHQGKMLEQKLTADFSFSKEIKKGAQDKKRSRKDKKPVNAEGTEKNCELKFKPLSTHEAQRSDVVAFTVDSSMESCGTAKPYLRVQATGANMPDISLNVPTDAHRLWTLVKEEMTPISPDDYAAQGEVVDIDKALQAQQDGLAAGYRTSKPGDAFPEAKGILDFKGEQLSSEEEYADRMAGLHRLLDNFPSFEQAFATQYLDFVFGSNCTCTIILLINQNGKVGAIKIIQPTPQGSQTGFLVLDSMQHIDNIDETATSHPPQQSAEADPEGDDPLADQRPEDLGNAAKTCKDEANYNKNHQQDDDEDPDGHSGGGRRTHQPSPGNSGATKTSGNSTETYSGTSGCPDEESLKDDLPAISLTNTLAYFRQTVMLWLLEQQNDTHTGLKKRFHPEEFIQTLPASSRQQTEELKHPPYGLSSVY